MCQKRTNDSIFLDIKERMFYSVLEEGIKLSLSDQISARKYRGQPKNPSGKWEMWRAFITAITYSICRDNHGKILDDTWFQALLAIPPVHNNCRCKIILLPAIQLGTATMDGKYGADMWIVLYSVLPDQYITKDQAISAGWVNFLGNLQDVMPGAVMGGNIFYNNKGKLPSAPGRRWYEADINYVGGYRGNAHILYSNDGLLVVTYDHYETFMEVY